MKNTSRRKADRQEPQFEIASYRNYRECADQYTDAYIRGAGAVKISETENTVRIAVAKSRRDDTG
ncbi:hypothetical protein, partial [Treponema socranskii]